MVVFLAGLQDIPETLYEAARLDGASAWSRFRHVTLPLLRPTTFYVATIGMIGCFQVFDQVFVMTGGGPLDSTLTIAYLLYREAFMAFNMGDACAIAFVLAALILACTLVQRRLMGA
ncbi:L-arabinose transport system permease protein AraP [compost metagenome]